jgi:CBS domain
MLTTPVRHPRSATVGEIRDFFRDVHVHAALIVSPAGHLEAVVERDDIAGCQAPDAAATPLGRLAGRTVPPEASLTEVRRAMTAAGRRRAAVTSADGRLLGLLCLKASEAGFCSDRDVRARALDDRDRAAVGGTGICSPEQSASHLLDPFRRWATAICVSQVVVAKWTLCSHSLPALPGAEL